MKEMERKTEEWLLQYAMNCSRKQHFRRNANELKNGEVHGKNRRLFLLVLCLVEMACSKSTAFGTVLSWLLPCITHNS